MVTEDEMRYSNEGENARFLMYQGYNDINIFVEDHNKEYEYEVLLKKVLGNECRIATIFSANGKPGVRERFNEYGSLTGGISNYYIVDGDFDRYIRQSEMVNDNCFIYLEPYNIENHLIDEDVVLQYVQGKKRLRSVEAKTLIDFSTWKNTIVAQAEKLFFLYCYVQYAGLGIPNTGQSPYPLLDEMGFEKENVYDDYRHEVESHGPIDVSALQRIRDSYQALNGEDYYRLICGKFLLASLTKYLRAKAGISFKDEDFRWTLVMNFNPNKLDYVKRRILAR